MPRPQRCRRICSAPEFTRFSAENGADSEPVMLTFDEFEAVRLIDLEKRTHEQSARRMDISRTTVTEIYESARTKIAECIVKGRPLIISGGNYRMCGGSAACCAGECARLLKKDMTDRGNEKMRIAAAYENGQIFGHFGHTEKFKFYDAENGRITAESIVSTDGSGHGALAGFLKANGVDALICGGIGGGARAALEEAGIALYGGVSGDADLAVKNLLEGTLRYNPDVRCSHHSERHPDSAHGCQSRGCGEHKCR